MVYITVKQSPMYHQLTLEEVLFQTYEGPGLINANETNTRTYKAANASQVFTRNLGLNHLINKLKAFNESTKDLREADRHSLYDFFCIPKKSGGLRKISAPKPELMEALRTLKRIFEVDFGALYHTSAFAYVKGRSTVDAVKRHQSNESRWFGKLDLHDFFGSTTMEFVMRMFSMVFPFSEVVKTPEGYRELATALSLAFLDGGLPQGTPISPLITNVMMIPVDFELCNKLRDFNDQRFVYTRYADDFIISSRYNFNVRDIERLVVETLAGFSAPFSINAKKTRYGSSAGRNWNLGVMLNKDNEITVGHKKKRILQSMFYNYICDKRSGVNWSLEDVQTLQGQYSYCRMVERAPIDAIIVHLNEKMGVDVLSMIKADLRAD